MAYGPKNSDYGSGSNIIQCQYVQSVHGYQVSVVPPWGSFFNSEKYLLARYRLQVVCQTYDEFKFNLKKIINPGQR